jgi:hypothetical protein
MTMWRPSNGDVMVISGVEEIQVPTFKCLGVVYTDDGGSMHLWNVGRHLIKNTAVHPRRFWASYSPPWELEISHMII